MTEIPLEPNDPNSPSIEFADTELELLVKPWALGVIHRMRISDPDYKDCWEACGVKFEGFQPTFEWGGNGDILDKDFDVVVRIKV